MIKTIKNSFLILKDNIILVQPLIIYMLLLGFLLKPSVIMSFPSIPSIVAIVSIFLISTAFLSGWFYINKVAVENKNVTYETPEEKSMASLGLLKQYFVGVGEYFLPVTLTFVCYLAVLALFFFTAHKLGVQLFGKLQLDAEMIKHLSTESYADIYGYFSSDKVSKESLMNLYNWSLYFSFSSLFITIFTIFWYPIVFYKTKNPFSAFLMNLQFTFKNLFDVIIIVLFLTFLNIILSFFNVFSAANVIISVISLLLMLFYMNYYVILVFEYYDEKNQSDSSRGAECKREDVISD